MSMLFYIYYKNINVTSLISYHRQQETFATVTAIQPEGRFGGIELDGLRVTNFSEKPKGDGRWISGGFFVCEPEVFGRIEGDQTVWEKEPLESLARVHQLAVFKHEGFWKAMDTLRDKEALEELYTNNKALWKIW